MDICYAFFVGVFPSGIHFCQRAQSGTLLACSGSRGTCVENWFFRSGLPMWTIIQQNITVIMICIGYSLCAGCFSAERQAECCGCVWAGERSLFRPEPLSNSICGHTNYKCNSALVANGPTSASSPAQATQAHWLMALCVFVDSVIKAHPNFSSIQSAQSVFLHKLNGKPFGF